MLQCYFSRERRRNGSAGAIGAKLTAMSFFRSRSRWGSYLALFALAFQLAVSFAHVHLDHVSPVPAGARAQLTTDDLRLGAATGGSGSGPGAERRGLRALLREIERSALLRTIGASGGK